MIVGPLGGPEQVAFEGNGHFHQINQSAAPGTRVALVFYAVYFAKLKCKMQINQFGVGLGQRSRFGGPLGPCGLL